jgi:hypothetical protein
MQSIVLFVRATEHYTKNRTEKNSHCQKESSNLQQLQMIHILVPHQLLRQVLCSVMYNKSVLASLKCACSTTIAASALSCKAQHTYQAVRARRVREGYQNAQHTTSAEARQTYIAA